MYYSHNLSEILLTLLVIVAMTAIGAKSLLQWRSEREDFIKSKTYQEAWHLRDLIEKEGDEAYEEAKQKYNKKDEF